MFSVKYYLYVEFLKMPAQAFKYAKALSKIDDCPSSICTELTRDGFRWVHSKSSTDDFRPLAMEPIANRRPIDETDLEKQCLSWGLSFFDTLDAATNRFKKILSYYPTKKQSEFIAQKGDCVAFISIQPQHGQSSPSNNDLHFTLFEYKGIDLSNDIKNIFNIFDSHGESAKPS